MRGILVLGWSVTASYQTLWSEESQEPAASASQRPGGGGEAAGPDEDSQSAQESSVDARLVSAEGDVNVFYSGEETGLPAEDNMPLSAGDKVVTGPDAHAEIGLEGEGVLGLESRSEFVVDSLDRKGSVFSLNLGTLLAKIRAAWAPATGLRVRTPTAVAAVRGTEFIVEHEASGGSHVGVFDEGSVALSLIGTQAGGERVLTANQEISVAPGSRMEGVQVRPLERFERRRARIERMRLRAAALRRSWRPLVAARRHELRRRMIQGRREMLREIRERRRKLKREGLRRGPDQREERSRRRSRRAGPRERHGGRRP